jgi:hypothetical protein
MKLRYPAVFSRREGELRRSVLRVQIIRGSIIAVAMLIVCMSTLYQRSQRVLTIRYGQPTKTLPPTSIHLIAERHSGSKWITAHLNECFGKHPGVHIRSGLTRWKHWFQENNTGYITKRAMVVTQFRHVHQWVAAMHYLPYHSTMHYNLTWQEFVERKWDMPKRGRELEQLPADTECQDQFRPTQVNPCLENERVDVLSGLSVKPLYEMRHDGSGQPYDNILQLRSDKIKNFLSIQNFDRVTGFAAIQYEDMVESGTASLLQSIEQQTGLKAMCQPVPPSKLKKRDLPEDFIEYLNTHVDWETEALIGYTAEG